MSDYTNKKINFSNSKIQAKITKRISLSNQNQVYQCINAINLNQYYCLKIISSRNDDKRTLAIINTDIGTMLRNYGKLNKRNHKKDLPHLRKHAMHLIRLFLTGLDILEGRGIHTYRREEHDLLLGIRAGDVSFDEVFRLTDEYEQKIRHAFEISKLPDRPDEAAINNLLVSCYKTGTEAGLF